MTQPGAILKKISSSIEAVKQQTVTSSPVDRLVRKISELDVPGKEHLESYVRYKWRINRTLSTLKSSFHAVRNFLSFFNSKLQDIVSDDIEAFVEHEQDRGLKITTLRTRLKNLYAFLRFLSDREIISESILKRQIRLKAPDFLPRAITPEDVRKLLSVIEEIRDRAFMLVLLRTAMRIGELLALKVRDIDIQERKIFIYEGEKNCLGRVVYLSDDVLMALRLWLKKRNKGKEYLFYGRGNKGMCYTSGRNIFTKYLRESGLQHKGYTVHSLRHTCASELLNAGMRLECLQQLLGHNKIEMTRRYARLTDKTREEEYFRAMMIIEKGDIDGKY